MLRHQNGFPFVKIVYAQIKINDKTELVPLELYADGSLNPNPEYQYQTQRLSLICQSG
jgi:hypothetical protein